MALNRKIWLQQGVYAAVVGPNLETRSGYRMLSTDRGGRGRYVDSSRSHRGLPHGYAGLATIGTDLCFPDALKPADVQTIIQTAREAEPHLATVICDVVIDL